ncbi:glutamate--tRNA ligase [Flavicella sp.]|uniref:glutamate--tRNA ligase n=1 Tax=Flavicella sp. TaxID=2957742 RepID=UPI003017C01D
MNNVRVRFAPSPTGPLHIGGVRTALYNYLFAKKHNGTFILRIEDTDQTRYVANAEQYIVNAMEWCGIQFDEAPGKNEKFGPYRQSERKDIYKKYADELIKKGHAYYAFDTAEELDVERNKAEKNKTPFIYNHTTRQNLNNSISLSEEEVAKKITAGDKYVIRFKMYDKCFENEILTAKDLIRNEVSFKLFLLDDKVLFKSDGMPTYHLANIVDDHLMKISHVIRGEEWLPSLPLHLSLYNALDWNIPKFAHLPLILKPVGKGKLSKRDGDKLGFPVFPLEYTNKKDGKTSTGYREEGYLPEAFINMLALLGWNPGTEQEIFTLKELTDEFSLERVNKSGAKFSPEKTNWFNQQYLQAKDNKEVAKLFVKILEEKGIKSNPTYIQTVVGLVKERAVFIKDLWSLSDFFFISPTKHDTKASKKQWKQETGSLMQEVINVLKPIEDFSSENIEIILKEWITTKEIGYGKVMQPLRLSLVGALKGPNLFDIASMIGKETSIKRIENAINILK